MPAAAIVASTLLVMGPVFGGGYVLRYDMVFAPRMPIGAVQFGLGSQLPRAVPSDLVVAALSHVLPGMVVQDAVLATLLLAAGFGAARLAVPVAGPRTVAALAYLWTPYLGERLLLGQWAVLVGWAVLPWVLRAARDLRSAPSGAVRTAWARLIFTTGVQCLGGAPAWILAVLVVPVALAWDGGVGVRRRVARVAAELAVLAVYALPWALPALLRPHGISADLTGAEVFRPSADIPFGTVPSLLTGGGIWDSQAVPPGRSAILPALGALLLLALGLLGAWRARRDPVIAPLAVSAAIGLGIALGTVWPAGARAFGRLPFGAVLRDSQRLIAPWVLLVALGLAGLAAEFADRRMADRRAVAAVLALLPMAVLPALAWGVAGRLAPVDYPADFAHLRTLLSSDPAAGAVVAVPFTAYRRFSWNGERAVLDPLPEWLDRPVVVDSDLPVRVGSRTVVVHGEDALAARVGAALASHAPTRALGALGVRWVISDAPVGPGLRARLLGGAAPATQVYRGRFATAYRIPAVAIDRSAAGDVYRGYAPPVPPVIAGDIAAAVVLVASGLCTAPTARRPRLVSAC